MPEERNQFVTHSEFQVFSDSVNSQFQRINDGLSALAVKLDQRSSTNWGWLAAWAAVLVALGAGAYRTMNSELENQQVLTDQKILTLEYQIQLQELQMLLEFEEGIVNEFGHQRTQKKK